MTQEKILKWVLKEGLLLCHPRCDAGHFLLSRDQDSLSSLASGNDIFSIEDEKSVTFKTRVCCVLLKKGLLSFLVGLKRSHFSCGHCS